MPNNELWAAGYQLGANPLCDLKRAGELVYSWTPRQAGVWEPANSEQFIIAEDVEPGITILQRSHTGEPYKNLRYHYRTVAIFSTVEQLTTWLSTGYGKLSEPGLPSFYNSWD